MRFPISRPVFPTFGHHGPADAFDAALKSGNVTNNGPNVQGLEQVVADYLGVECVVCVSSGTAALVVMLKAAGVGPGDEVIVPSFTFCATPHAVVLAGATPVFADIQPDTLLLDPADVARRVTARTRAIMPVDAYGVPYPDQWLVGRFSPDVQVLLDAAPSFGANAVVAAEYLPTSRARAYSFHATKPFSTMEGGCIATDDAELARRARHIAHFGIWPSGLAQVVGLNAHMLEVSAIMGLAALPVLRGVIAHREAVARAYAWHLRNVPGVSLPRRPRASSWCYFPILLENKAARDAVRHRLAVQGIEARPYYVECHTMPAYKSQTRLPVTEAVSPRVLALPIYSNQTDEEVAAISHAVKEAVR